MYDCILITDKILAKRLNPKEGKYLKDSKNSELYKTMYHITIKYFFKYEYFLILQLSFFKVFETL